jgi:hypothetical protein
MQKLYQTPFRLCFFLGVFFVFLSGSFLNAQSNEDELQLVQSLYGMEKRDIVDEFVELSEAQAQEFWRLYDEYEAKRKELGKTRFVLVNKYVDEYGKVSPANADTFMKEAIQLRNKNNSLLDSYYKKIKSRTDPVVAMQFYQIERYLSDLIRIEILEEIYTTKTNN